MKKQPTENELDIHTFNRLPRPELFKQQPLVFNNIDDLRQAFPYLFKPNRAIALHPAGSDPNHDPGHPIKDKKARWLIKFTLCNKHLAKSDSINTPSIFVVVINQEGWLSLWRFASTSEKNSGLFPVNLPQLDESTNSFNLYQTVPELNTLLPTEHNERFELMFVNAACDEEDVVIVRLNTPKYELLIKFDFSKDSSHEKAYYHHTVWKHNDLAGAYSKRQVGGYGNGEKLFWNGNDKLIEGSSSRGTEYSLPHNVSTHILSAAKHKDFLVVGGEDSSVWHWDETAKQFNDLDKNHEIKGYVHSVELLPQPDNKSGCLILVGCDDYFFYILDIEGNLLQKVKMQGLVEGLLYLDNQDTEGVDIAVLVRNQGVYCVRLFYDKLRFKKQRDSLNSVYLLYYRLGFKDKKHRDKEVFLAALNCCYGEVQKKLRTDESDTLNNILAIAILLKNLQQAEKLFNPESSTFLASLQSTPVDYLKHFLIRKLQNFKQMSPSQQNSYFNLLHHMAAKQSPLHIREVVRSTLGWLKLIRHEALSSKIKKQLNKLAQRLPDEKRTLCNMAQEIYRLAQNKQQCNDLLAEFLSIQYDLSNNRVFNNEIILPKKQSNVGQVDSTAIVGLGYTKSKHIYACRGTYNLYAFSLTKTSPSLDITSEPKYQPNLDDMRDIRILLPIGIKDDAFIVVANHKVGLAKKGQERVDWNWCSCDFPASLQSAALYPVTKNKFLLAIAGGWHITRPAGLYLFKLDKNTFEIEELKIAFSNHWQMLVRFRHLMWDQNIDRLWGVTDDRGHLCCWDGIIDAYNNSSKYEATLKSVVTIGSPQNAVLALENSIICGGNDGVLRAFDSDGRLQWLNLIPGQINHISTTSNLFESTEAKKFSRITVITDKGDLLLYTDEGQLKGGLYISNNSLTCLFSNLLKKGGYQHHWIGTMTGEVRLIEEVPSDWQAEKYLIQDEDNKNNEINWKEVKFIIEQQTTLLIKDIRAIRQYCNLETALRNPLITGWAVAELLKMAQPQDYVLVIKLLKAIKGRETYPNLFLQKMQTHIFSELGKKIDDIPNIDKAHAQLCNLCKTIEDKAFAAFIQKAPYKQVNKNKLFTNILDIATDRALNNERFMFSKSALLRRFRESQQPLDILAKLLQVYSDNSIKNVALSGFTEGLIAILFSSLKSDVNSGILFCLSRITVKQQEITELLISKKCNNFARNIFHNWLDNYHETIFSYYDARFWRQLSFILKSKNYNLIPDKLDSLVKSFTEAGLQQNKQDILALKYLLGLFPNRLLPSLHERRPQLSSIHEPPLIWENYIKVTEEIRAKLENIHLYGAKREEVASVITELDKKITNCTLNIPLLNTLHKAWQKQWKAELKQIGEQHYQDVSLPNFKKAPSISKELEEAVIRFFLAMKRIDITNGRFYKITDVPDNNSLLELVCFNGELLKNSGFPFKQPAKGMLAEHIKHLKALKFKGRDLIYHVYHYGKNDKFDEFFRNWKDAIQTNENEKEIINLPWVAVPVISEELSQNDNNKNANNKAFEIKGLFAFSVTEILKLISDEGYESDIDLIIKTRLIPSKETFLKIIDDVVRALELEERDNKLRYLQVLKDLDDELFREENRDIIQQRFIKTALDLTNANGAILAVHLGGGIDSLVILATVGEIQENFKGFRYSISNDFYPIVHCWKSNKNLFLPNLKESTEGQILLKNIENLSDFKGQYLPLKEWIKSINSYVAMPIWSGRKKVGVISLHSKQYYNFDKNKIEILETLVRRIRWFLHAIDTVDYQRMWEKAFAHEMLSDLKPISDGVDEALETSLESNAQQFLEKAQAHCQRLRDLSYTFRSIQTKPQINKEKSFSFSFEDLQEFVILYDVKEKIKSYHLLSQEDWNCRLIGEKQDFYRILRNIFNNALKFGSRAVHYSNKQPFIEIQAKVLANQAKWQLKVLNPGHMSDEENLLKFEAYRHSNHRKSDGFHIGLAASQVWANASGGKITLENVKVHGQNKVQATLEWLLAKKIAKGNNDA